MRDYSYISKSLEEGRAERRAKARAKVAAGWTPPKPTPKPIKQIAAQARKELEARAALVDEMLERAEVEARDFAEDYEGSEISVDDVYHDVAQSLAMNITHVADRKDYYRRAGILPGTWDTELAGWDWLAEGN